MRPYDGTSGTPSPTRLVIARSEATRQSVFLFRADSHASVRRGTWAPPYGAQRSCGADRVARPDDGTSGTPSPTRLVIARSEATRQSVFLFRADSHASVRRGTWAPPYGAQRSCGADRVARPDDGTSGTPSPTRLVIARSEATRQSVFLFRADSHASVRRGTWAPPYGHGGHAGRTESSVVMEYLPVPAR